MSELSTLDCLLSKNDINMDNNLSFETEPEINISSDYETPDLMSSEFFDSIMSLEKDTLDADLGITLFDNIDLDMSMTSDGSCTYDEVQCETSTYSDSGLSSDQQEMNEQILSDEELLKSILEQTLPAAVPSVLDKNVCHVESAPTTVINTEQTTLTTLAKLRPQTKYINIVKPIQKPKQVIRIQPVSGNSRSVLLPINIKDLKTIKIINTNNLKAENIKFTSSLIQHTKKVNDVEKIIVQSVPGPDEDNIYSDVKQEIEKNGNGQYPLLVLTSEEKRLLNKDGIQLPCRYPLTKHEERELKRIRRKIRNKISAQDSRKRKKEYVDGLEERVKQCSEENRSLLKRIKLLQTQNIKLSSQLSKLQELVFKTGTSRAHPATCLMIVLLSVMLVTLPNLRNISNDKELNSLQQYVARRALLCSQQVSNEDSFNTDEFIAFSVKTNKEVPVSYSNSLDDDEITKVINSTKKNYINAAQASQSSKLDQNILLVDKVNLGEYGISNPDDPPEYNGKATRKRFIEPDIDEYWPPEKKKNTSLSTVYVNNNCHIL